MRKWRIEDSEELYNITGWGTSYFGINDKGHVVVTPRRDGVAVDLKELVDELQLRDVAAPTLVRFPDILDNRIEKMSSCFKQAAEEYGYKAENFIIYPIKVNQMRPVGESTCDVEVTPSNTGCFYYFDLAAKADFDTWGTDAEIVASVVADLKETAAYYQANGYDLDWTDFLSIGPDGYEFTKLSPDTEYVVYAFALTEEGRPLTGVTRETVRTEAFVPTDDCTFGISFRNVSVTAFDISVRPSNAATRYYIGVCSKELFDKNTPSSIADAFIEMENGYEIDWAGNEYIWTGDVTVDTDADLAMGDLDAGTDYVAVVFGVSTEGVRTTEVASAVQRTSELVPSTMTIGLNVRDVTASGAKFDVTPSNTDEVYFADVFVYDEYTAYDEGKEAYAEVYMDILKAYGLFDYSLYSGNRTVDFTDMLEPSTTYVAVAFGYNGGRTTKIFESEPFTTSAAASGTVAKTVRSRRHGSLGAFRPERRSIEKQLSVDAGSPRGTLARFSSVADLRELPSQGLRGEPSDAAGLHLRRF